MSVKIPRLNAVKKLLSHVNPANAAEKGEKEDLEKDILRRKAQLSQVIIITRDGWKAW